MPEKNPLVAAGDTITVALPKDTTSSARFGIQNINGATGLTGILEASMDDGVTWEAFPMVPAAGGAAVSTPNAVGTWTAPAPGYTHLRYRVTALTTLGPVLARWNITKGI